VSLIDEFTGNGVTTAFTLGSSPASKTSTNVYINGVYQHKDTYSLTGAVITFSEAPYDTALVEVSYV
jgi:hypothetical protein